MVRSIREKKESRKKREARFVCALVGSRMGVILNKVPKEPVPREIHTVMPVGNWGNGSGLGEE